MFGPQDVTTWELGYGVWWTACIYKVIIENGTLAEYCDKIRAAEREYGPELWWLIYQEDCRFRSDHLEEMAEENDLDAHRKGTTIKPEEKWQLAFQRGLRDEKFW